MNCIEAGGTDATQISFYASVVACARQQVLHPNSRLHLFEQLHGYRPIKSVSPLRLCPYSKRVNLYFQADTRILAETRNSQVLVRPCCRRRPGQTAKHLSCVDKAGFDHWNLCFSPSTTRQATFEA
jgi:hypothetical protein